MDSITQFALGACVGVAILGRKIGPRKAALTGGILGTLPDLDVFLSPTDPIEAFVQHRSWTHSLFVHTAITPILGETVRRLFKNNLQDNRISAYCLVFLCLSTHALLDAITVYGTRLFWPIFSNPVGLGSIFIIDPLYTLPLLLVTTWAFKASVWSPQFGKALVVCLILSTAYLGWTAMVQQWMTARAEALWAKNKVEVEQMIAIPTPFNSLVWRIIGISNNRYFNLYMPVFGSSEVATLYGYTRNLHLGACETSKSRTLKIAKFSHGFYRIMLDGNTVVVADVRMGLTPNYAFKFGIGKLMYGKFNAGPTRRLEGRGDLKKYSNWFLETLLGNSAIRHAEATAKIDLARFAPTKVQNNLLGQC